MKPRMLPLDNLILEMEGEHDAVLYELTKAENDLDNLDYEQLKGDIVKLQEMLSQHTIDEQRSLLGFLIERLGRKGSNNQIEIMRNQTQIMNVVNRLSKSEAASEGINISDLEELRALLWEQFKAEQSLYLQASLLRSSDRSYEYDRDIDRYENEGGK